MAKPRLVTPVLVVAAFPDSPLILSVFVELVIIVAAAEEDIILKEFKVKT